LFLSVSVKPVFVDVAPCNRSCNRYASLVVSFHRRGWKLFHYFANKHAESFSMFQQAFKHAENFSMFSNMLNGIKPRLSFLVILKSKGQPTELIVRFLFTE
jgi:hypothetical protein